MTVFSAMEGLSLLVKLHFLLLQTMPLSILPQISVSKSSHKQKSATESIANSVPQAEDYTRWGLSQTLSPVPLQRCAGTQAVKLNVKDVGTQAVK